MPGPVPQREDQTVRRNKPEIPIDKVEAIGIVEIPQLGIPDAHPFVTELYESMKNSAQKRYYEPSDWATARIVLHFLNKQLWSPKPSAQMVASISSWMTSLLLTEGDRRRMRIEIERDQGGGDATVTDIEAVLRAKLAQGQ